MIAITDGREALVYSLAISVGQGWTNMIFMTSESNDQTSLFKSIDFAANPGDEGGWYWEVMRGQEAILRGMAETERAAREQARAAAREANLIP